MKWIAVGIISIKTIQEAMKSSKNYDGFIYMAFPTVVMWMMVLGGVD